jgi:SagB-type dehydrogenase family enzyme
MTKEKVGDRFQELTKYGRERRGGGPDRSRLAEPFKSYPEALARVDLPSLSWDRGSSFWKTLGRRRSRRDYTREPMAMDTLARLLWATQGVTARISGLLLRTAPSAGALYPIETYLVVHRVEDLEPGLYHLDVQGQALELLIAGNLEREIILAALNQEMCASAPVVFIWTAIGARAKWKYGERAYRYIYLDAGHIGENLYLAAEDLGLGCCGIGAFLDDQVNELLGVDGETETAVYLAVAGKARD